MSQAELIAELMSEWTERFYLQPENSQERQDVITIQALKKMAAMEILRLQAIIDDIGGNNGN